MNDVKGKNLCKPLHLLKCDHGALLETMQKISQLVDEIQQGSFDQQWDKKWYQLYQLAVHFLAQLKTHVYKEEHFLFPIMEPYLEEDDNMLMVMDYEHKTVEQKIIQFIETFEKRKKPLGPIEALSLLSCLEFAKTTIVDHIHKEDNVLFTFADQHLGQSEIDSLLSKIEVFG